MKKYLSDSPIWLDQLEKILKLKFRSVLIYTPDGHRFEASLELESEKSRINESCRVALKVKQLAGFEDGKACYSYLYLTEDSVARIDLNQTLLDHETLIINLPEEVTSYAQIEIKY